LRPTSPELLDSTNQIVSFFTQAQESWSESSSSSSIPDSPSSDRTIQALNETHDVTIK
jgi:hypothetical protein